MQVDQSHVTASNASVDAGVVLGGTLIGDSGYPVDADNAERPRLFPRRIVGAVFLELWRWFDPEMSFGCKHALCDRLCAVGGYRRGKLEMKDLELLYIPRVREEEDQGDMFGQKLRVDVTARLLDQLVTEGALGKRLSEKGAPTWGPWNKHAVHVATGLPVDLFAATRENWANRLVVTTGSRECNIRIAAAARAMGWEWEVYDAGFVPLGSTWETATRERRTMHSEREIFDFVGLPYLRPEERI